jgi:hypothetical protein
MNMKTKIIAVFILVSSGISAQSQILRGGVNLANITITNDGDIDENKMLSSFQAGLIFDCRILPILSFQPGIVFTGKGSKTESGETSDATYFRSTSNPYYIEIPANFVLKTPGPVKLFAGAGPYIAIGVAGKNKVEGKVSGIAFSGEDNIEWSDDDPATLDYEEGAGYGIMKRFDYGLNATAGIEMAKLVLGINYGHGLAKLQSGSNSSADDKNKHRVLSLTLGIKLK